MEQDFIFERKRDEDEPIWRGFFRADKIRNRVSISSYSLETFFTEIGGLAKTLSFICGTLALVITRKTFMLEILQNLFKVRRPIFSGLDLNNDDDDDVKHAFTKRGSVVKSKMLQRASSDSDVPKQPVTSEKDKTSSKPEMKRKESEIISNRFSQKMNETLEDKKGSREISGREHQNYMRLIKNLKKNKVTPEDIKGIVGNIMTSRGSLS